VNAHLEGLLTDHRRFADPVTLTLLEAPGPKQAGRFRIAQSDEPGRDPGVFKLPETEWSRCACTMLEGEW